MIPYTDGKANTSSASKQPSRGLCCEGTREWQGDSYNYLGQVFRLLINVLLIN